MSLKIWSKMSFFIAVISVLGLSTEAMPYTQDEYEIRDHMRQMYDLKDQIFSKLAEEDLIATADILSNLRVHLHSVMPKEPNKIKSLPEEKKRELMMRYQKYIAQVIIITLDLEETVLQQPLNDMERSMKEDKIRDLVTNMMKVISLGHAQFR